MTGGLGLYHREFGRVSEQCVPAVLVHGLFGSCANWQSIARKLQGRCRVICPDLRNHGRSPHAGSMDYPSMSGDLLRLLDRLQLEQVVLVGHSMGAKVVMWLALHHPERVARLMSVDMAPVRYPSRFSTIISALQALDVDALSGRAEARSLLLQRIENPQLVDYLLQNLALREGGFYWRMNLGALATHIDTLLDFPPCPGWLQYPGPAMFVYGERSEYLGQAVVPRIMALFPLARMRRVDGAGHWLYADKPEVFLQILRGFLG